MAQQADGCSGYGKVIRTGRRVPSATNPKRLDREIICVPCWEHFSGIPWDDSYG